MTNPKILVMGATGKTGTGILSQTPPRSIDARRSA
jgi:hypothetical protein